MRRSFKLLSLLFALTAFACSQPDPTEVAAPRKSPDATHNLIKDEGYQNQGPIKCSKTTRWACDF